MLREYCEDNPSKAPFLYHLREDNYSDLDLVARNDYTGKNTKPGDNTTSIWITISCEITSNLSMRKI